MKAHQVLGCVGTALMLLLASVWIPVPGPFFSLLTPLPFLYYSAKLGVPQAVKLTCVRILASGLIAAGFSLFLSFSPLRLVAVNALVIMLAIYFFHGLSILLFFLNKYRVPPWMRLGVYALILVQQILVIGVTMAGLFDQWLDLRRIHQTKPDLGRSNS
jgi:uncharacterized protein YybS (DUF2232 family)